MLTQAEYEKLGRLLNNLNQCTGIKFGLLGANAVELYAAAYKTPFCKLIGNAPGGFERCRKCDDEAISRMSARDEMTCYRCHAGLVEVTLPIKVGGATEGIIIFGQVLDDTPLNQQWRDTRRKCDWYGDMDELHRAFKLLKVVSQAQIRALSEIVNACISEVRLDGLLASANRSEARRVQDYIAANYSEQITIDGICGALNISKSKLYSVCRTEIKRTVGDLICEKRIDAARALLKNTDDSVRQISETVGYPDFNYFSKVFRRVEGMTPSQYRGGAKVAGD